LVIKNNITDNLKGRTSESLTSLKRNGYLNRYFCETEVTKSLILIAPSEIICKCVVRELGNGRFLLSQFDIETDYN
jgi:hypothetical protein